MPSKDDRDAGAGTKRSHRDERSPLVVDLEERIPPDEFNTYKGCFTCFCGPFADESCGYPPNTVRAILALFVGVVILGTISFGVVYYALAGNDNVVLGLVGSLFTILGVVTTFYFTAKGKVRTLGQNGGLGSV